MTACSRVERMKKYLEQHAEEIEHLPTVQVQFDCAGDVVARMTRYDKLRSPAPLDAAATMD